MSNECTIGLLRPSRLGQEPQSAVRSVLLHGHHLVLCLFSGVSIYDTRTSPYAFIESRHESELRQAYKASSGSHLVGRNQRYLAVAAGTTRDGDGHSVSVTVPLYSFVVSHGNHRMNEVTALAMAEAHGSKAVAISGDENGNVYLLDILSGISFAVTEPSGDNGKKVLAHPGIISVAGCSGSGGSEGELSVVVGTSEMVTVHTFGAGWHLLRSTPVVLEDGKHAFTTLRNGNVLLSRPRLRLWELGVTGEVVKKVAPCQAFISNTSDSFSGLTVAPLPADHHGDCDGSSSSGAYDVVASRRNGDILLLRVDGNRCSALRYLFHTRKHREDIGARVNIVPKGFTVGLTKDGALCVSLLTDMSLMEAFLSPVEEKRSQQRELDTPEAPPATMEGSGDTSASPQERSTPSSPKKKEPAASLVNFFTSSIQSAKMPKVPKIPTTSQLSGFSLTRTLVNTLDAFAGEDRSPSGQPSRQKSTEGPPPNAVVEKGGNVSRETSQLRFEKTLSGSMSRGESPQPETPTSSGWQTPSASESSSQFHIDPSPELRSPDGAGTVEAVVMVKTKKVKRPPPKKHRSSNRLTRQSSTNNVDEALQYAEEQRRRNQEKAEAERRSLPSPEEQQRLDTLDRLEKELEAIQQLEEPRKRNEIYHAERVEGNEMFGQFFMVVDTIRIKEEEARQALLRAASSADYGDVPRPVPMAFVELSIPNLQASSGFREMHSEQTVQTLPSATQMRDKAFFTEVSELQEYDRKVFEIGDLKLRQQGELDQYIDEEEVCVEENEKFDNVSGQWRPFKIQFQFIDGTTADLESLEKMGAGEWEWMEGSSSDGSSAETSVRDHWRPGLWRYAPRWPAEEPPPAEYWTTEAQMLQVNDVSSYKCRRRTLYRKRRLLIPHRKREALKQQHKVQLADLAEMLFPQPSAT